MEPLIKLNFIAIGLGTLAFFFLGFLWYTPLFGKIWAKEMGFSRDMEVSKSFMIRSLLLNLFGNFLLAFVLTHNIFAWDARSWGHDSNFVGQGQAAAMSAIFTWLGFSSSRFKCGNLANEKLETVLYQYLISFGGIINRFYDPSFHELKRKK